MLKASTGILNSANSLKTVQIRDFTSVQSQAHSVLLGWLAACEPCPFISRKPHHSYSPFNMGVSLFENWICWMRILFTYRFTAALILQTRTGQRFLKRLLILLRFFHWMNPMIISYHRLLLQWSILNVIALPLSRRYTPELISQEVLPGLFYFCSCLYRIVFCYVQCLELFPECHYYTCSYSSILDH